MIPARLNAGFALSTGRPGAPLHAAAHSHHPWPDVTRAAHLAAWDMAAAELDRKWPAILQTMLPQARAHAARVLNLPDPDTIVFAPNIHGFVNRLISACPAGGPVRVLTSDGEFHSFARQVARLEEEGLARVTRVPVEPHEGFSARVCAAAQAGDYDLVYVSQVFFNSGLDCGPMDAIAGAVRDGETLIAIDGYHGFMAVPSDLSAVADRCFYLAGGYKYAMAGEGVCFMHCPPGYAPRPRDTGWYAGFGALSGPQAGVAYPSGGERFAGATFDPSGLFRFNAVQDWLVREDADVPAMLGFVRGLEDQLLTGLTAAHLLSQDMLTAPDPARRGRFLVFRTPDAAAIEEMLAARDVIVDRREDRLRIGLGIYHDAADIARLLDALKRS